MAALKAENAAAANNNSNQTDQDKSLPPPLEETTPRGLNTWREATARAHTSAQLAMALYMLEASIAWDKSIMKAVIIFHLNTKPRYLSHHQSKIGHSN